jgi:hypothetical protein
MSLAEFKSRLDAIVKLRGRSSASSSRSKSQTKTTKNVNYILPRRNRKEKKE